MLKKLLMIFGLILMVNATILMSIDQSRANATQLNPQLEKQREDMVQNISDFSKNSKEFKLNTKKIEAIKSQINNKKIELHNNELDYKDLFAKKYKSDKYVYIPINHEGIKENMNYSYLALILDNKENIKNYMEFNIIGDDENYTSKVEVYSNGKLIKNETLQLDKSDFNGENDILLPGEKEANALNWWGRFKRCMNGMGVASWVISSISIVCSGVCVATLGSGCVACIVAAGLASEGVAAKCATEASLKKK
ncbi:hypothetical protein EVU91_13640 [Macrococcoides bohemicum]|uniref:hypothetical protein n=1 Tax=Macrococcoides bohemicum TaxID=1903056 RepID=UPI00105A3DB9|nr:hypothetical protein [Macrococcus bohemicus]TDL33182.1 hypothetical protein EVU91_13640 [Macrococcus bohemicus]